ncbi:spore germination protein [Scopulibacillus darangshiensis]|uniref:Spore germination protein n=1 Tax=Scopulibacillus darangshiensis TaxID=442528 RepID=A0A4R2NM54_9BACL|nr:spore germination protein [Scopulibacillus darangshiensis]TCP22677.1 spore germination protein [Scopulibacillus darangshiensis]
MGYRKGKSMKEVRKQKVLREWEKKKMSAIKEEISKDLDVNIMLVNKILGGKEKSGDLIIRHFNIGANSEFKTAIVYMDGLVDNATIDNFILKTQMIETRGIDPERPITKDNLSEIIKRYSLTINEIAEIDNMQKVISAILYGDTVLFIDGSEKAFDLNTKGWEHRPVGEPHTENVIRGPKEAFTETLRVNTALMRIRLKDPDLRVKQLTVGERTNTYVALVYIEGVADQTLLEQVERRIKKIEIDGVLESGYIEQMIEDSHWSPFPTLQYTERTDKAVANVLEGKIVVIVDGTPFVLIAPSIFTQFYQSPEDYYERFWIGTFIRFIRLISLFIALFAPSLYIALSSFHPEMIPSELEITMAAGRSTVPFPAIVEAMLMEISIEILREAGVRLPGVIGPTIGIVGALVIGQAAVQAGLVSPIMVIIVALTTIGSFACPSYNASIAIRLLRFPMMISAALFGLYGMMLFTLLIILHLCSLKSFGVPYIAPISPSHLGDLKDILFRAPLQWMNRRPVTMKPEDDTREETRGGGNDG